MKTCCFILMFLIPLCDFSAVHSSNAHASDLNDGENGTEPAWKIHPCLAMLGTKCRQEGVTFTFRSGVSLRRAVESSLCEAEICKEDGVSWRCREMLHWYQNIDKNVHLYPDKRFGISWRDLRFFFLAKKEVEKDLVMWPLWQILFAKEKPQESPRNGVN